MRKVGILSDTHGYINPALLRFFEPCEELWHAGDWGDHRAVETLQAFRPVRGVYGNIDGREVRSIFPEVQLFSVECLNVCMLHIGGYPGKYNPLLKKYLSENRVDIAVTGHSHILKVMRDKKHELMFFNPGAAGNKGFHHVCTALRLDIDGKRLSNLEVWEQKRAAGLVQP